MSRQFGEGQLGQIVYGSTRYQLTWEDLLWAIRMIEGESGNDLEDASNVLWAQTQRLAAFHGTSFTRIIQGQSQPINPKWREDGEFCRIGGRYHGTDRCSQHRLETRRNLANKQWHEFSSAKQDLVYNWATANLPNRIPKAVDFAQPGAASHHNGAAGLQERHLIYIYDKLNRGPNCVEDRGNVYYATPTSNSWPDNYVSIQMGPNTSESHPSSSPTSTTSSTTTTEVSDDPFDRHLRMGQERDEPPHNNYPYYTLSSSREDPETQNVLSESDEELVVKNLYTRFFDQVNALKNTSTLEMSQVLPTIIIWGEEDGGNIVNLTEEVFSQPTFHNIFNDNTSFNEVENSEFPERPIASVESLTVDNQTPAAGGTGQLSIAHLKLKIHNPSLITREHPKGKFIAYMLTPGYGVRIRFGVTHEPPFNADAFQWKEQGFVTTQYEMTVNDDKTINLNIMLQPNAYYLMNRVLIGESIPASDLTQITQEDINNVIDSITSNGTMSQAEVDAVRRRINQFGNQFNSAISMPALRSQSLGSGTFGSTLRGAIRTSEILSRTGADSVAVPIDNTIEAIASLQSILLSRRFESIIQRDAYNDTLPNSTPFYAINCGPMIYNLVRPEIEMIIQYTSENNMQIGETTSLESEAQQPQSSDPNRRNNVSFVFGNFNAEAGQWANRPISAFPLNAERVFAYLRRRRMAGEFSSNINAFINNLATIIHDPANYSVGGDDSGGDVRQRITHPEIKFLLYPDPRTQNSSNWIFYVYDNKEPIVKIRQLIERMDSEERLTKQQIIDACNRNQIPWIEMGMANNFVKTMSANTRGDDTIQTNAIIQANEQSGQRRADAAETSAGIFSSLYSSDASESGRTIVNRPVILPFFVRATTFILTSAFLFAPIYIFFPIQEYSGIFMPQAMGHEISNGSALTNLDLQINVTFQNRIQT